VLVKSTLHAPPDDGGFTLAELLMTMAIAGTLALISVFGFVNYRYTSEEQGSARRS